MFFATEVLDKVKSNFFSLVKLFFLSKIVKKNWEVDCSSNFRRQLQKQHLFKKSEKYKTFYRYSNVFSLTFTITTKNWEGRPEKIKFSVDFFSPQNTLKICLNANQQKKQLLFHVFHRSLY